MKRFLIIPVIIVLVLISSCVTENTVLDKNIQKHKDLSIVDNETTEELEVLKEIPILQQWVNERSEMLLNINDDKLSIINLDTYEQEVISYIQSEWIDNQPTDGFKLTLNFTDETDGLMNRLEIVNLQLYESRNFNTGGITGANPVPGTNNQLIFDEPQSEIRHQVAGWRVRDAVVTISGVKIKNLAIIDLKELTGPGAVRPNGDFSNPFTIIQFNSKPESWISDFRQAEIVNKNGVIRAVNKKTKEEIELVRVNEKWESNRDGTSGHYIFSITDLSSGLVLGGSFGGVFRSGDINGKRANVYTFSYRLDSKEIITQNIYKYIPDENPKISYLLANGVDDAILSTPDTAIRNRNEYRGTIAFKDGNVLPVNTIE